MFRITRVYMQTAFFLGAGASVCFGKPTTKELLDRLSDKLPKHLTSVQLINTIINDRESFPDIEDLYTALNDVLNLENGFGISLIDNISYKGLNLSVKDFLSKLKQLKTEIRNIILDQYNTTDDQLELISDMYCPLYLFLIGTNSTQFRFITTNYDTTLDIYARNKHTGDIIDGFVPFDHSIKRWTSNFKSLNSMPLYLLKLHGSVNWYKHNGDIFQSVDLIRRDEKNDVMIAPTLTSKRYNLKPFNSLIKQFKKILNEINVLVVIGFSFRDKELAKMMKDAVKSNDLKIISISPTANDDFYKCFEDKPIKLDSIASPFEIPIGSSYYSLDITFDPNSLQTILSALDTFNRALEPQR